MFMPLYLQVNMSTAVFSGAQEPQSPVVKTGPSPDEPVLAGRTEGKGRCFWLDEEGATSAAFSGTEDDEEREESDEESDGVKSDEAEEAEAEAGINRDDDAARFDSYRCTRNDKINK